MSEIGQIQCNKHALTTLDILCTLPQTHLRSHYKALQLIQSVIPKLFFSSWVYVYSSAAKDWCLYHAMFVTGGTVHMVCRNKDKAEEARADIVKETGNKVQYDSLLSKKLNTGPTDSPDVRSFITLNVITGGLCPHPGPVWDQEGLGVCRGFQEKVQGSQCASELLIFIFWNICQYVSIVLRLCTKSLLLYF